MLKSITTLSSISPTKQGNISTLKLFAQTCSYYSMDIHAFNNIVHYRLGSVINDGIRIDSMKPKPDDIKEKLAFYGINRLQGKQPKTSDLLSYYNCDRSLIRYLLMFAVGMFNRLNTEATRHVAFAEEAQNIFSVVQQQEGDSLILKYLLFKMVNLVITNSQEE